MRALVELLRTSENPEVRLEAAGTLQALSSQHTLTFFRTDNGEQKAESGTGEGGDVPSFLLNLGLMETCIEIMNEERTSSALATQAAGIIGKLCSLPECVKFAEYDQNQRAKAVSEAGVSTLHRMITSRYQRLQTTAAAAAAPAAMQNHGESLFERPLDFLVRALRGRRDDEGDKYKIAVLKALSKICSSNLCQHLSTAVLETLLDYSLDCVREGPTTTPGVLYSQKRAIKILLGLSKSEERKIPAQRRP